MALEQVPHQSVPPVEGLGVDPVEVPHQSRQRARSGAQHQVVVIAHEAIGKHRRVEARGGFAQNRKVRLAVGGVTVDRLATVTARGDVEDGAGEFNAKGTRHTREML